MIVKANEQGFSIEIGGEEYLNCPAQIAVDADGKSDADERYLPMRVFETRREGDLTVHIWRTQSGLWEKKDYVLECGADWARRSAWNISARPAARTRPARNTARA